ncbi:30S ribosomal protein S8e [Candidatus Woesearchaeota archaeon]|nr:MAG: 30S ribosomal protein S8e [Candidatus Woesearchaeota archaeon]
MAISQKRSHRKVTGGVYKRQKKKPKANLGRVATLTKLGNTKRKNIRVLGGNLKTRLFEEEYANVVGKDRRVKKVKIKAILENPANRHYVRRNILTKGTIIDTELGKARITSRPAQVGVVNAILLEE